MSEAPVSSRQKTGASFRLICGWSYYENHSDLEAAMRRRDELRATPNPAWERDPLYLEPTVYRRDESGHYLTAVES